VGPAHRLHHASAAAVRRGDRAVVDDAVKPIASNDRIKPSDLILDASQPRCGRPPSQCRTTPPTSHITTATPMRLSVRLHITVEVHGSRNSHTRGIGMNKMTASNRKRAIQTQL